MYDVVWYIALQGKLFRSYQKKGTVLGVMVLELPIFDANSPASGQPKYQVLKEHFARQIENGELGVGASLPTELELCSLLGVARSTVRRAMQTLEQDGLIQRIQGRGTFVRSRTRQDLKKDLALFALIVPETRTAFYPSLLHSFEEASRGIQHQAIACNTQNNVDIQGNTILQLIDKKVSGVAIVPTTSPLTPAYQIRQLQQHNIPVVFLHRPVKGVQAPLLKMAQEKMGYLAGKKFTELGHQRIMCMALGKDQAYRSGLQKALREAGADLCGEDICQGTSFSPDNLKEKIPAAVKQMLSYTDRPTAIFASFDSIAELIYLELLGSGVRVPEDISLIGVGGTWREEGIASLLTSIVVDETDVGRRAVNLLAEMQQKKRSLTDEEQFELPIGISEGKTLGPASLQGSIV